MSRRREHERLAERVDRELNADRAFFERFPHRHGGLVNLSSQLRRALLQRTERFLELFASGVEFHLADPFLDPGFAPPIFFFSREPEPGALLVGPHLPLHCMFSSVNSQLIDPAFGFSLFNAKAFFSCMALFAEHLAAEQDDAHLETQRQLAAEFSF